MKTLKLTEVELRMLREACTEFYLGFAQGWEHSAYSKKEIQSFYQLLEKISNNYLK